MEFPVNSTKDRVRQFSDTKKILLRQFFEDENLPMEKLLSLEGSSVKLLRSGDFPLFLCPATDGSVSYMRSYLPYIPENWAVYGCQSAGLEGEQEPFRTVPEIAAHNIEQIRRIQPTGPYFLAGNCMGGLPAYEMATQLQAQGEEVPLVLHLMPMFNRAWAKLPGKGSIKLRALVDYIFIIERMLKVNTNFPIEILAEIPEDDQPEFVMDYFKKGGWLSEEEFDMVHRRIASYRANLDAMLSYEPKGKFKGTLTVVGVGKPELGEVEIPVNSPYAAALRAHGEKNTKIITVDADGFALFDGQEPHMAEIGKAIQETLARFVH